MKNTGPELILQIENRIPTYYVSGNGQTKFYTLAGMLLEGAAAHADLLGFGYHDMIRENVYWVLSRFHVRMHSYPVMNQPVRIETWPKGVNKLFYIRDYRMFSEDGVLLASATSAWIVLDGKSGRPKIIESWGTLHDVYTKNQHAIDAVPGKLPSVPEPDYERSEHAFYSDLDINNHVNAIKYIEWIQDCYDEETYNSTNVKEFQINYQLETRFAEEVNIRKKNHTEKDSFDYFEGIRTKDNNPAFRARIAFGEIK